MAHHTPHRTNDMQRGVRANLIRPHAIRPNEFALIQSARRRTITAHPPGRTRRTSVHHRPIHQGVCKTPLLRSVQSSKEMFAQCTARMDFLLYLR